MRNLSRPILAKIALLSAVAMLSFACGNASDEADNDDWKQCQQYPSIGPDAACLAEDQYQAQSISAAKSLCELIEVGVPNIGVYQVESIESCPEDDMGKTYVEFVLVDGWHPDANQQVAARFDWGPVGDGECAYTSNYELPELAVDEEVVIFRNNLPEEEDWVVGGDAQYYFKQGEDGLWNNSRSLYSDGVSLSDLEDDVLEAGFDPDAQDFCANDITPSR